MALEANRKALAEMAKGDLEAPVIMLNLLRFREMAATGQGVDGLTGEAAYGEYGRRFAELGPKFGGEPIWMGDALNSIIGEESWDRVILVRYPTRRQFLAMLADPAYQAIAGIRAAAIEDSRLVEIRQRLPAN